MPLTQLLPLFHNLGSLVIRQPCNARIEQKPNRLTYLPSWRKLKFCSQLR